MSCEEVQRAIPWLLDDELEPVQTVEIEGHLETCEECRVMLEAEGHLRETLRRAGASITAPPSLRHRVQRTLDGERRRQSWVAQWVPAMAAAAILLSLIWRGGVGGFSADLDEATRQHARNLPVEAGPDVAAVQRFFNDNLQFAVRLPELREQAEPGVQSAAMLGGRITKVRDREAALVRYKMPRGRISVFVYSDPDFDVFENAPVYQINHRRISIRHVRGYTVARWRYGDLVYSVVTDLPEGEMVRALNVLVR